MSRLWTGCLALSILLHLAALDALSWPAIRGAARSPHLQIITLEPIEPEATVLEPLVPKADVLESVKPRQREDRSAVPVVEERTAGRTPASRSAARRSAPEDVVVTERDEPVFRPMNPDEGKVAYRLALLAAMPASDWPALAGGRLRMELAFGAGGRFEGSQILQTSADDATSRAWQIFMQHAVAQAALPDVLREVAFSLELEVLD